MTQEQQELSRNKLYTFFCKTFTNRQFEHFFPVANIIIDYKKSSMNDRDSLSLFFCREVAWLLIVPSMALVITERDLNHESNLSIRQETSDRHIYKFDNDRRKEINALYDALGYNPWSADVDAELFSLKEAPATRTKFTK